jgi:hypothetical protein
VTDFDIPKTREETFTLPFVQNLEGFDVLLVVDKSAASAPLAGSFAEDPTMAFDQMDYIMQESAGGPVTGSTIRIGVITPDLGAGDYSYAEGDCEPGGDDGVLQDTSGCFDTFDGAPWLELAGDSVMNAGADLSQALQCVVEEQQNRTGCRFKQPLAAVEKALDAARTPENEGFLRPNAGLAIILLIDEDDCSAANQTIFDDADTSPQSTFGPLTPFRCFEFGISCDEGGRSAGGRNNCAEQSEVSGGYLRDTSALADRIRSLKGGKPVIVTIAAGPRGPISVEVDQGSVPSLVSVCGQGAPTGRPSIRLNNFVSMFEDNGLFDSVCTLDLAGLLNRFSNRLASNSVFRCMPFVPADVEPKTPGSQFRCAVEDVKNPSQIGEERFDIPACAALPSEEVSATDPRCWVMVPESQCTAGYQLVVRRWSLPEEDTITEATCEVEIE